MTKSGLLQIQSILKSCGKGQDLFPQDVPKVVASPHATHSYYSLWCNAMHKYYPDIPMTPWKAYEFKNAKCFSCLGAKAIDFFDVIIGDWYSIMLSHCAKLKTYPKTPNIGFVTKLFPLFVEAYEYRTTGIPKPKRQESLRRDYSPSNVVNALREKVELLKQEQENLRQSMREKEGEFSKERDEMLYQLFTNTKNKTNRHRFTTTTPQDLHETNEPMKNGKLVGLVLSELPAAVL
jgi:hypothetical protein